MRFKDIVNRDIVNLENCEQEPIHIPGSIQGHGFLLGLTEDLLIDFCSGNVEAFTGTAYTQMLGKHFSEIFGTENEAALKTFISSDLGRSKTYSLIVAEQNFSCNVHRSGETYIIDAESMADDRSLPDTYEQTRQFLSYMEETSSLQQLCDSVARGARELTGYDRVMVYRFDEQYNGEIFSEAKREDLEPFLGLHYPHTDIPVQARELYLKNLLRIIVDVNYTPVPIYTIDNKENKNLDLGRSSLRSISPIHIQYLQNMGVGATLTISLVLRGRLWGLIACHHYSAKNISPAMRLAAQLQGHFITSQIDVRLANEEYDISKRSNEALEKLLTLTYEGTRTSFNSIISDEQVLHICNASGVCIISGGNIYSYGKVPGFSDLKMISERLAKKTKHTSYNTNQLAIELGLGDALCQVAAGIVYYALSVTGNDCIMWFRGESRTEVTWAGDPEKAIVKDENGLHPRKSFEQWKEIVKCKSNQWQSPELNAAANYAHSLEKHVTLLTITEEEEKYRKLSEVLKASNEELENVNWISAHDLQEPLRKIQLMSSRILASDNGEISQKNSDLVRRMNTSAHKMQSLLRDILDFVKVKNVDRLMEPVSLSKVVFEVSTELADVIKEKGANLEVGEMPQIMAIPFLVKQLFVNIISNSLKFTSPERPQVINISAEKVNGKEVGEPEAKMYHKITITDSGIGFDDKFSDRIFKIFARLHTADEYSGSGVGLALCKKIMQSHEGHIRATGKKNEGAEFILYFPLN